MQQIKALLSNLTTSDLNAWAGARIYSRGKSYLKNVEGLSRTDDGALAAWVSGSKEYATSVGLDPDGELEYVCTCPYECGPCKHAVAVLLAAAEQVKRKQDIPLLDEDDALYQALFGDEDNEDDLDDWQTEYEEPEPRKSTAAPGKGKKQVVKILEKMSKEELIAFVGELSCRYPEIERGLLEQEQLATGKVDKIVASLRREIRNLTAEPAYYDRWSGESDLPDYSHVEEQLRALLAKGHADAVLELGEELWTRGNEQVEQSHDDGDTGMAIAECMKVVLQALPQASLTRPKQLLWVIDRALEDDYSLLESPDRILNGKAYTQAHWLEVAHALESRLKPVPKPTSAEYSDRYRRNEVVSMLIKAYEKGGQRKKIIPLLEREAETCQCYVRLVDALLLAGEREKARQWCISGYERTVKTLPGLAADLQKRLREMAHEEKNHEMVAAYRAQDFFGRPSRQAYIELRKAAEKAKVWQPVRTAALGYLESGRRPDLASPGKVTARWPLPVPEVVLSGDRAAQVAGRFPDFDMLIDIAILEKRLDDAVALYGELRKTKRYSTETYKAVASAVAGTHPQVALDIWRSIVDGLIAQVKPAAYEEAAVYLRQMCKVYQANHRMMDWVNLLGELRREHKPKRRLMEVLDGLSGKNLLD